MLLERWKFAYLIAVFSWQSFFLFAFFFPRLKLPVNRYRFTSTLHSSLPVMKSDRFAQNTRIIKLSFFLALWVGAYRLQVMIRMEGVSAGKPKKL